MKYFLIVLFTFFSTAVSANGGNGRITGVVKEAESSMPLPNVEITIKGTEFGTVADFDGVYEFDLKEGNYTLVFTYMGFEKVEVTNVLIKPNDVTIINIDLKPEENQLDQVVITATQVRRNTEASVLNYQKASVNLMDGISAQSLKRTGAGNLAAAVKKIPGVTVQGGKYVYVRGLGDRYTKTTLNSIDIPGLDPDKNTLQMDIFSTSILDNIKVIKSFTADLPADFTGGLLDIITKDFPTKETYTIAIGTAYNPEMHFNANYLTYKGSNTDLFGYDNGFRDRPIALNQPIPNTFDHDTSLTKLTKEFNPNLGATQENSLMNYSFGFSAGNQFTVGKKENKLGYIASLSYKNGTTFYDTTQDNIVGSVANDGEIRGKTQAGSLGKNNIIVSGLAGLAFKTKRSKYKLNLLHIQNGESQAGQFLQNNNDSDFVAYKKDYLDYTQRAITNAIVSGTHTNDAVSFKIKWNVSTTLSAIHDKDARTTAFQIEDGVYSIKPNTEPKRIWRDLQEQNHIVKVDFQNDYKFLEKDSKLKYGVLGLYKNRDYNVYAYQIGLSGNTAIFNGNANSIMLDENLWTTEHESGSFIRNTTIMDPANQYNSNQTNLAGYVSNQFKFGTKLKTIVGLRLEQYKLNYTGKNTSGNIYDNKNIIDKLDVFPSLNVIYALNDDSKLRFSYTNTTARPSFKEASIAEIYDPLSSITFIGNVDLKPSYINNVDIRYETFQEKAQMYAFSAFYKNFKDPIELTYYQAAPDNFTPRNLGSASVYGIELEMRKNLSFVSSRLKNFRFNFNTSIIKSVLEMGEDELTLRQNTAQEGDVIEKTRSLQGQAPYLVNFGVEYTQQKLGLETGLYYNVQGETLEVVGGIAPDVYTKPFHDVKFTLNKSFGTAKNSAVNLKVSNILGQQKSSVFKMYKQDDYLFSSRNLGTTFSLGYTFKF